ncbi:MAG: hypothetical protein KDG52_17730 [Rhodocyclaceae bacterium]|nr:hypothetical protein [Rhodocyclaceae bacterium]
MTTRTNKALVLTALALASGVAMAGISATKHNLTASGPGPNQLTSDPGNTQEICVFCHTPHGANTDASAPLWNKNIPDPTGYQMYSSTTMDAATIQVGSVSAACLSCHDGTQAMDNMINTPGSGTNPSADPATAIYVWDTTNGGTANGIMPATSIANLGQDLTNDHPIGIQYCGGGLTGAGDVVNGTCADGDFNAASTRVINGTQVFWVNTSAGASTDREKNDIILYTRDFTGATPAGPAVGASVECASCHDPHVEAKAATEVSFLRVSQANSGVCLACHNK